MPFLGHIIGDGKIQMDGSIVQAILDWELPTKVTKLRSFLRLVNYYKCFIKGHSTITRPLTDMLKKGKVWDWSQKQGGVEVTNKFIRAIVYIGALVGKHFIGFYS
ncbi:uncharacterized protein LOC111293327 [Durio zibethinus]|uniref:Uncharacterized protein LOC111293327 n=1 Tax=Durio zibethinus TaxID=66656 RepID=A0A6P5YNG6_DURZI|nr:uncharacterized protein LOC111293327 [Durio zibethinus]